MTHDEQDSRLDRRAALGLLAGAGGIALAARAAEPAMPEAGARGGASAAGGPPGGARAGGPPAAAAPAGGPRAGGPPPGEFRAKAFTAQLQRIAPDVYVYVQLPGPGDGGRSLANVGLIGGAHALLAIDATAAPLQVKAFMAAAQRATAKPFGHVVVTHHHPDHILGLQYFGDVDVVAHEECRVRMAALEMQAPLAAMWSRFPGWADGNETPQFRRVLPNVTYRDAMTLWGYGEGDGEVRLLHLGRGHTTGDTALFLPRQRIVFAGDTAFFGMTPLNGAGYIKDWIAQCEAILALDADVIIPGHGPVGTKKDLAAVRDYLSRLYTEGRKLFDAGVPAAEAGRRIDMGPFRQWPEAERTAVNLNRLYTEFDGTIKP